MIEPTIVTGFPTLYVPIFSKDDGRHWEYLQPATAMHECKARLRSRLPSPVSMESDKRFKSIKCGMIIIPTQHIVGQVFVELVAKDFINDTNSKS